DLADSMNRPWRGELHASFTLTCLAPLRLSAGLPKARWRWLVFCSSLACHFFRFLNYLVLIYASLDRQFFWYSFHIVACDAPFNLVPVSANFARIIYAKSLPCSGILVRTHDRPWRIADNAPLCA